MLVKILKLFQHSTFFVFPFQKSFCPIQMTAYDCTYFDVAVVHFIRVFVTLFRIQNFSQFQDLYVHFVFLSQVLPLKVIPILQVLKLPLSFLSLVFLSFPELAAYSAFLNQQTLVHQFFKRLGFLRSLFLQ